MKRWFKGESWGKGMYNDRGLNYFLQLLPMSGRLGFGLHGVPGSSSSAPAALNC